MLNEPDRGCLARYYAASVGSLSSRVQHQRDSPTYNALPIAWYIELIKSAYNRTYRGAYFSAVYG